jgi:hypothetical protein
MHVGVVRPPLVLGARRVLPAEDDYLGKPKFSIPRFDGEGDVEDVEFACLH